MIKVAITGSSGLVGSRIIELLHDNIQFIPILQSKVDITDKNQLWQEMKNLEFDLFLHLAAYTNVDQAENEKDLVFKVNRNGTQNVFDVVTQKGKKCIYISTDFVFDGITPPFTESSSPNPISEYGKSKYEGEKIVLGKAMIVRISYPYRKAFEHKTDFMRGIKNLLEKKQSLSMVSDSLMTPTFIDDIAYSLQYLMNNFSPEVFHIVGSTALSPYEAALAIADFNRLDSTLIRPVSYSEYFKGKAKRPKLSHMKSNTNTFFPMKSFEEGLKIIFTS